MAKKMIAVMVERDYDVEFTLATLIERLQKDLLEYGETARIVRDYAWGDESDSWGLMIDRLETDEEYAKRLEKEKEAKEKTEARELEQFKRLAAKYAEKIKPL